MQNYVVVRKVRFKPEHYKFWSNFEFDGNIVSGTGAWSIPMRSLETSIHYKHVYNHIDHSTEIEKDDAIHPTLIYATVCSVLPLCCWGQNTRSNRTNPDSKVPGANMGPIWGRQDPGGPHVSHMNFAILD